MLLGQQGPVNPRLFHGKIKYDWAVHAATSVRTATVDGSYASSARRRAATLTAWLRKGSSLASHGVCIVSFVRLCDWQIESKWPEVAEIVEIWVRVVNILGFSMFHLTEFFCKSRSHEKSAISVVKKRCNSRFFKYNWNELHFSSKKSQLHFLQKISRTCTFLVENHNCTFCRKWVTLFLVENHNWNGFLGYWDLKNYQLIDS
jgi:hypothetical protein